MKNNLHFSLLVSMEVTFNLFNTDYAPFQKTGRAGFDFYSPKLIRISPGREKKIKLGLSWIIDEKFYGIFEIPSGTWQCHKFSREAGVIDGNFRGEICVCVRNNSRTIRTIEPGEKIAQMLIYEKLMFKMNIIRTDVDEISDTSGFKYEYIIVNNYLC